METKNSFEIATKQLDDCAKILNLKSDVHEMLRHPMRELHVSIPVRMDNGAIKVFQGFAIGVVVGFLIYFALDLTIW